MHRFVLPSLVLLPLLAGAGGCAIFGEETPSAEQSVRDVIESQVVAWNKGNLDGFLASYWDSDQTVFISAGDKTVGLAQVAAHFRSSYQGAGKAMGQLHFDDLTTVKACDDFAYAYGRWQLDLPDGTKPGGRFTVLLRKFDTVGWKIIHDHTSVLAPAKTEGAPADGQPKAGGGEAPK